MHAAGRGRRAAAAVPRPAVRHTRAAVLLETGVRRARPGWRRIHRAEQPVPGDRRQPVPMPEHVPRGLQRQRRRAGRQPGADLLLYQGIVRAFLRRVGPHRVPKTLKMHETILRQVSTR